MLIRWAEVVWEVVEFICLYVEYFPEGKTALSIKTSKEPEEELPPLTALCGSLQSNYWRLNDPLLWASFSEQCN